MITPKTPSEIQSMRVGGAKIGAILQELLVSAEPGVSLLDIEAIADQLIQESGGQASFRTVKGYKWATCLCVNDVVVHGIPTNYVLKDGDVLTIDVGLLYQGFHTDTAWTKIINSKTSQQQDKQKAKDKDTSPLLRHSREGGNPVLEKKLGFAPESLALMSAKETFLQIGEQAMWEGIAQSRAGNRVGHISLAVQKIVESAGYGIVKTLVGHGVGRELHEAPQIPGFVKVPIDSTPLLVSGMTIAVEVIYARGSGAVVYINDDGWSIGTRDGSLAGVFEHTIVVTDGKPEVLTHSTSSASTLSLSQG